MSKKLSYILLFISFSLCFSCVKQVKSEKSGVTDTQADAALDSFFQELYEKGMFNGAVAVKKKGKLIVDKGYGKANFAFNRDFTPETPMEVASVSKQFTAAAIMILAQEDRLEVGEKAQKYLGEDFPYPKITIQHLLTHTSGLVDYEPYFRKHWDTTEIASNKDILAYFKEEKPALESVPGEKYKYSNSGYVLLAEIVNAVSGEPLDQFLKKHVFIPAGMEDSGFYERDTIWKMEDYAPGYMWDPETCKYTKPEDLLGKYYYVFLSGRFGSGRLSTSVEDLMKWDSVLYDNKILNKTSKEEIFQVHQPEKDTSDYGFGWHIYNDAELGKVVFHTGSWAGNLSFIKRFVDEKSLIITLNNTYSPYMKEIRKQVEGYLKGDSLSVPKPKLEVLLQEKVCELDTAHVLSWYNSLSDDVEVDPEKLEKLLQDYRDIGERGKAKVVEQLISHL